jgi:polyhydroxyalkanoate synthase
MADKRMQPTWDPLVLAAQLRNIAEQSQLLMQRFVSHQPNAIKFGIGGTSTLGFDFFELTTRMMTDPVAVARAQIDLFYNSLDLWQKAAERMLCAHTGPMLRKISALNIRNGARMPFSAL